jgi:hypothetical protein
MDVLIMFLIGNIHVKFMCLCEIRSMDCGHEMHRQNGHLVGKRRMDYKKWDKWCKDNMCIHSVCDIFQTQNLIEGEHDYNKFKHLYQLIFGSGA